VRGQAYLSARAGEKAAEEFQKILDHSGIAPTSPRHALARLGLARAYALSGDIEQSIRAYDDFFLLWKHADSDLSILNEAKKESLKLAAAKKN
jgi:tetratricopeptide (TPR) repeat protein